MDLCRQFGANVKRLRKEAGLSQEEFAEKAGVARSYMSDVEVGDRNPTLKVVERLALALGVPAASLLQE
ncbi:MAG: helix-turn-helix transcriptional regulator [Sphingobium sp.]